jgi:hypothetical protein
MHDTNILFAIGNFMASALVAVCALIALLHFAAPQFLVQAYRQWQFPRAFHYVPASALGLAALFLAVPQTRIWGVILGAMILFVTVVSLLNRGKIYYAMPAIALMAALPSVLL